MLGNMHTSSGGRRFMNRRTLYGSAYLLVSTGLLTAGFTSYAAAPDLTGQAACVQQAKAAPTVQRTASSSAAAPSRPA